MYRDGFVQERLSSGPWSSQHRPGKGAEHTWDQKLLKFLGPLAPLASHGCWTHVELRRLHEHEMPSATDERCWRLLSHRQSAPYIWERVLKVATQTQKMSVFRFLVPIGQWFLGATPKLFLLAVLIYENTSIGTQRLTRISAMQKEPKSGSLSLSLFSRGLWKHCVPWGQPCAVSAAVMLGHYRPLCWLVV